MAYDGLFFRSLVTEISAKLTGGKVDKIHQPEKDELSLSIRAGSQNYKLKISADASLPHLTLTEEKKENPMTAPMFCMLLRKHLAGGRILSFKQIGLERIVEMEVESRDELGDVSIKVLAIEIMGKHSNIILYQKDDLKILECIKRVSLAVSRTRQIFPGIPYTPPPFSKRNLLEELPTREELNIEPLNAKKYLVAQWQGFSPSSAQWLLVDHHLPLDASLQDFDQSQLNTFIGALQTMQTQLAKGHFDFAMIYDDASLSQPKEPLCWAPTLQDSGLSIKAFDSAVALTNTYFGSRDQSNRLDQKGAFMRKSIALKLEKSQTKLAKLHDDFENAEQGEHFKILGELILANLYKMEKGIKSIEVENYYKDPVTNEVIELEVRLSPTENAQRYFKKYNKAKTGQIEILHQLEETQLEVEYLEQVLTAIDNSTDSENLDEIRSELAEQGYIKRKVVHGKPKKQVMKVLQFKSSEGYEILVGKNNLQNDYLTLKLASNKDLWLHTKVIPGSHVIIRTGGEDVGEQTIFEAAVLAAYHSKARLSGQVPVDYTLVKNVSKPSGAKPGMVIYQTNKTLYVTPDENLVLQLKH